MAHTKLQRLQAERAEILAILKEVQALERPDLENEALDLLEENADAIRATRPKVPDLPIFACGDGDYHRPGDWHSIY